MRPKISPADFLKTLNKTNGNLPITDTRAAEIPIPQEVLDPYLATVNKYGEEFNPLQIDPNDVLGTRQSTTDAITNGVVRALGTAIGSASEIISAPLDLTIGAITGDMASGPVGELFSDLNESLAEAFPIYYTKAQQEMGFLESLGTDNFWADKFLNGAGYLAGAWAGGKGLGMLFKTIGKGAKAASAATKVGLGTEAVALGQQGSKLAKFANPAKQLAMAGFMAHGEAAVEARDVRDTMFGDLVAKRNAGDPFLAGKTDEELMDISEAAGNTTYAWNLPIIAGSDVALFGKALFPNLRQTRKVLDVAGDLGAAASKEGSKLLGIAKDFGKGFFTEGGQELSQLGISEGTKKFYLGQYSNSAREYSNLVSSIVGETINNLGSKEGLESIFLGGILGGSTSVFTSERGDNKKAADAYSTFENSTVVPKLNRLFDNSAQTADASAMQDQYAAKNDKFGFKNEAYNVVKGLTKQAEESGGTDTLIDRFEALKGTDVEEFKRVFGYTEELTEQERDAKVDQLVATVKDVSEKHKQIVDRNPQLNPALYPQNRPVFDAIFDAVTNFEDIDKRENDIASQIMGLTATTDNKMVASIYGPYMKEYVKKGIDYEKFRNSDDYKEKYGNTVQEYIDAIKEENPDKAAKLETLSKDLYKLAERREEMIKQYNEAIEQPEKIQKEAEAAIKRVNDEKERLKAEADAQAAEALKTATEVTPQPAQTPEEAANLPLTPEQVIGGTPGTVVELPITTAVRETKLTLDQINEQIAKVEGLLNDPEIDPDYALALESELEDLYAVRNGKQTEQTAQEEEEKRQRDEIEAKQKEEERKKKEEEQKKGVEEQHKEKTISEENKTEIGSNTFSKTIPPTDKQAADKVIQKTPVKDLVKGLKIKIASYTPANPNPNFNSPTIGISFEYNGVVLGFLPYYNKFKIKDTNNTWEQLTNEEKLQYFKINDNTSIEEINAQHERLKQIWSILEKKGVGTYTMEDLSFLEITPSLGELDVKAKDLITVEEAMATLPVAMNGGNPVIKDRRKKNYLYDNAPAEEVPVPAKLEEDKVGNRYLILIDNGYQKQWIVLKHTELTEKEFKDIYKDVLELQARILEAKKNGVEIPDLQAQLDAVNTEVRKKYYTASKEANKKYAYVNLSDKGTFSIREATYEVGVPGGDKVIDKKSGIKTIEKAFAALNEIGIVKGNEETLRLKAGFKNGGLKVNYNEEAAKAAKVEEQKEPVATTTENTVEDIERRRQAELEATITDTNDLMVLAKVKEKNDPERLKREIKRLAGKTQKGNNLLELYAAEDTVGNLSKTLAERVTASLFLEGIENQHKFPTDSPVTHGYSATFNDSQVSDIHKQIDKLISSIIEGRTHLQEREKPLYNAIIKQLRNSSTLEDIILANKLEAIQSVTSSLKAGVYGFYKGEKIVGKTQKEVLDKINAKYDAELAALESTPAKEAPVVEESNKEEIKKEEEALKKLQEGKEKLEQEERELQKLLEEVEEKAKKEEEKEKLAEKVIAENVSEEDKEKIAEEENVDKAQVDSWLKDKFIKYITGGFIPKVNSTLAKVFKKLKTIVLSLFLGGSLIITSSAFSTNNDGKVTFNVENAVENLLPDTQEQWAKRFLDKQGLITIADNQIVPKAEEVVVNETPKPEKFFQIIGSVPDSYNSKDTLLSYRSQWDNSTGFRYIPTPVKKDLPSGGLKVSGVVGVGHFLLDGSAQNNYSHGNNAAYLRKAKENNEWIPVFTKQADNSVIVKYKKGRDITAKDRIISPLRQMPFNSIAFDKSRTAVGFKKGVNEVVKKDGEGTYLLFKNRDGYSRFSGGSVVFIFQDKYGNTIVRDFAGSLNQIENEGINITKAYNLNPNDLIIGYHDVGSFSAKPKAKDGEISSNQWEGYNPEGMTGGALLIPIEGNIQPTSSTPISSQPTKAGLNWALLLGLSTLLKKRKAQGLSEKEIASIESRLGEIKQALASINNEILAKQEVLNKLKGVPQSTTKALSRAERFKQKQAETKPKDTDNYSVSDIPAEVKIQMDEAVAYLKSILPFEVGDVDSIAARLNNNGITFGAFIDNVIYLNKAAKAGTEYHEAFHAVMSLLSTEERNKYLEVARKEHKITDKARAEFILQRPVYQNLSKEALDKVMLEEYLADKFMAWKQGKKEPNGFFAKMFDKIKKFFDSIKDYFSGNLDSLFHRIDSGKFKHSSVKGSKLPYFMALPYMTEKIQGTNDYITRKLNSAEETNLINTIRAEVAQIIVDSLETGKVSTIKEAFDRVLEIRDAVYSEATDNSDLDDEAVERYYNKNAGLFLLDGVKEAVFEKVKSQIQFLLSVDEDITDRLLNKEETEGLRDYEKSAFQNTGLSSMSQYVRLLLATAYTEATDELGVKYKKGLNASVLYNSMSRTLLNTKPENFMNKLEVFGTYNPEVRDFVTYFKNLLNWNQETNSPGLNNKGDVKNQHIWNAFKQGFYKFKVNSEIIRVDTKGEVKVSKSNFKDVDTQQVEKWKVGYKNFVDKRYHEVSDKPFYILQVKSAITDEKLAESTREIKLALDEIGIKLSPLYIEYSILVNKPASTEKQELLMSLYENFNGLNGINNNNITNLLEFINTGKDPFKEGDIGAMARLKGMAMENASFDETAGTSTFQNAKGELVSDTSLGSFFLKRTAQLQQKEARSENQEVFENYYANQEDAWMLPLHFMSTVDNPLYEHEVTFDKDFVFSNIDGIRAVQLDKDGNEVDAKEGVVFKDMSPLEKILTFMSLYTTTKTKTTKEGKKVNYAYYYPQVIEAASTGYAALLPVNILYTEKGLTKEFYNSLLSFVKNEHARIKYLAENPNLPQIRDFNVGKKNGFKFFVNAWLDPTIQEELKTLDNLDEMSTSLKKRLVDNMNQYVENDFNLTMATLIKEGVVTYENGVYTSSIIPKAFKVKETNVVDLNKIRSMQANYLINGQAFNTLLHGDLAYKVKNPEDHVKRLKGAHGAFTSLYGEQVSFKVIPDVITYKYKQTVNGVTKFFDVTPAIEKLKKENPGLPLRKNKDVKEGILDIYEKRHYKEKDEIVKVDENEKTNAQAYTYLKFQERRLSSLGKFTPAVAKIYDKIKEGLPLTRVELELLEGADALLNPKKDLAYALNAYVKMSVQTLTRELTSYKVDGKWEAIPGREVEHAKLDEMEAEEIDMLAYESGSKGTTILNEKRILNGEYYGEQVATKGVKTKITDGTQQLALIWSELPSDIQDLVEKLDEADQERIIQSTEYALSLLKDGDVTSLKKVLPDWYSGLLATGASPQLLDIFKPNAEGEPSLNPNLSISVDKFTAMYLAHWSNHALKQKVAGAKFTLVTPMKVMVHEGKVVRADQFKANPSMEVTTRDLGYNMETTKDGKKILYAECIVSSYYKELYNLKEGDEIPEELAYMMGYRIPTEDKPSMVVLKVVDFMPAIYGNAIMVPEEIQYLSGADFDIDSLFVQKYDIYEKDGKFHKYGSATTSEGQFEEFINWTKEETDVESYQKTLLEENEEYQALLSERKEITERLSKVFEEKEKLEGPTKEYIEQLKKELYEKEFITAEDLENFQDTVSITEESLDKDVRKLLTTPQSLQDFKRLKEINPNIVRIKANKLASALRYYKLPASKTAWAAAVKEGKYPDGKFKAVLNNEMLDIKIEMLGNPKVQETLASEKTSNDPIIQAEEDLREAFPQTFSADKASLNFFSFNDLAVAMSNNDAGKTGIGPAAVFNVVYQYLAKMNSKINGDLQFSIKGTSKSLDKVYNYYQFRGFNYDKTGTYVDTTGKRIVRSISAVISAMTDNAKNPVAAKLNLNIETLGPALMMLGVGVEMSTVLKIINSAKVKALTTEVLSAKSDFVDKKPFDIVNKAKDEVSYITFKGDTPNTLDIELLNTYLTDPANDIGDTGNIALKIYLNAREASQYMLLAKDLLDLKKGVPATFSDLAKVNESYNKLVSSLGIGPINGLNNILDDKVVYALTNGLVQLNRTAENLFISQSPALKKAYDTVRQQTKGSERTEVSDKIFKAFNSFMSLGIFRQYLKDANEGKTKKYKARFLKPFTEAFTKEALFETTLLKEVENLQRNAKELGLQNNRFVRYINTEARENTLQVDKIEGNTRQLRDPDYQQELINGFDDLYANPLTRDTAIKLFAYILLKDGARYRNASFQSEIPSYMFSIYSDALNEFQKNPKFVDTEKLGNEFIKVWSLTKENAYSFYFLDAETKTKAEADGAYVASPGKLSLRTETEMGPQIAAAYNFTKKSSGYVPIAFISVAKNLMMLSEIDGQPVKDLTELEVGDSFEYVYVKNELKVDALNAKKRGVSAYSFPLDESIELFGETKKAAPAKTVKQTTIGLDEYFQAEGISDMPVVDSASASWEATQLEESLAKPVTEAQYKEIKAAEKAPITNPTQQLKEWGVEVRTVMDEYGFASTEVVLSKEADERTRNIVDELKAQERKPGGATITESLIFTKLKEADTKETLKKVAEC